MFHEPNVAFCGWLIEQAERDDAVGNFAAYIAKKKISDDAALEKSLLGKRVPKWVIAAKNTAHNEWTARRVIARKGESKEIVTWTRRQYKRYGEMLDHDGGTEVLAVRHFVTEPAEVSRSLGFTVDMGQYQSASVRVGLRLPCYVEEIDSANEVARQWLVSQVESSIDEIRGDGDDGSVRKPIKIGTTEVIVEEDIAVKPEVVY